MCFVFVVLCIPQDDTIHAGSRNINLPGTNGQELRYLDVVLQDVINILDELLVFLVQRFLGGRFGSLRHDVYGASTKYTAGPTKRI